MGLPSVGELYRWTPDRAPPPRWIPPRYRKGRLATPGERGQAERSRTGSTTRASSHVFALAHGFAVGTDSATAPLRITFLVTGQVVIVLVAWRVFKALPPTGAEAVAYRRKVP